jgi:hypothetical protein
VAWERAKMLRGWENWVGRRPRIDLTELFLSEDIGRRFEQGAVGRGTHQLYEVADCISQSPYVTRADRPSLAPTRGFHCWSS